MCDPRTQFAEKIRSLSQKARFNEASKSELFALVELCHEAADLYDQLYGPPGEYKLVERFASRDIGLSIGDVLMAMSAGGGNGIHIKVTRTGISRAGFEEADFAAVTTGPFTGPSHMSSNDPKGLWEHLRGQPHHYVLAEDLRVGDEIAIPEARVSIYKLTKVERTEDMTVVFGGSYIIDRSAKSGMARKDFFGSAQRRFELMHGRFQEVLLLYRGDELE